MQIWPCAPIPQKRNSRNYSKCFCLYLGHSAERLSEHSWDLPCLLLGLCSGRPFRVMPSQPPPPLTLASIVHGASSSQSQLWSLLPCQKSGHKSWKEGTVFPHQYSVLDIRGTRVGFAESTTHPTAESKRFEKISFLE